MDNDLDAYINDPFNSNNILALTLPTSAVASTGNTSGSLSLVDEPTAPASCQPSQSTEVEWSTMITPEFYQLLYEEHPATGVNYGSVTKNHLCSEGCGQRFGRIYDMRRHVDTQHSEGPRHGCPVCDQKAFARKDKLYEHLTKVHGQPRGGASLRRAIYENSDRKFECAHSGCTSTFRYEKDLTRHWASRHLSSARRSFFCPKTSCLRYSRGFARKDNLRRHIRYQHPEVADTDVQLCLDDIQRSSSAGMKGSSRAVTPVNE